jgi:hypothetical protein
MSAAKGFWSSLPGMFTAAAGLIAAVSGLLAGLRTLGWIGAAPKLAPPVTTAARPATNLSGAWDAEVTYDWGATHRERIVIEVLPDGAVRGSASFLGVPRGIVSGKAGAGGIEFVTETEEMLGDAVRTTRHGYQATATGQGLEVVMQTTGAAQPHTPVRFTGKRALN